MKATFPASDIANFKTIVLATIGTLVLVFARVDRWWAPALAVLRGGVQLAVLSVVLTEAISDPLWVSVALAVMFVVASLTSARRVVWSWRRYAMIAGGMFVGVSTSLAVIFVTGAVEFAPRYVLALGGILIGGSMTIATLTIRRLFQSIADRWDEVEAWFALGASPRQATAEITRNSVREALVPATDQTKTVGLVTLPGAFIGAIFGGLDPIAAGRFQIVVLAGILATAAMTSVIIARSLSPVSQRPLEAGG
ncbi:MAG: ABC transporter permease [Leucobacter sp.]